MVELQAAFFAFAEGYYQQAQSLCLEILAEYPDCGPAWHLIGVVAQKEGKHKLAIESLQKAIFLDLEDAQAHYNLAVTYNSLGNLEAAQEAYQKAIDLRPSFVAAHYNLGNLCAQRQQLSQAEHCYRKAVHFQPELAQIHANLGFALLYQGKIDGALESFRKALDIDPTNAVAQDNLLLAAHYADFLTPIEVLREHQNWGHKLTQTITSLSPVAPELKQQLRIGYLSPDFCTHSVSYFFEPILAHHRHDIYEIFCYSCTDYEDETTKRLQSYTSNWRSCGSLSDLEIAEQIRADQIDILVDLAGHTTNNRLRVLAYKPSPIQITYLGYPGTSGLPAVDYRITDKWADPTTNDIHYTEKLIRLETGFLCYAPPNVAPPVSSLPAQRKGYITFGSFNNLPKINASVVAIWSEILKAVPNSQLLLKSPPFEDAQTQAEYKRQFVTYGIASNRLSFLGRFPNPEDHLACYEQVDIALDPFPYNGTTTTCESLWMGVPVITLAGTVHASRVGVSLLSSLDLVEFIATTPERYIQIATNLAEDRKKLEAFRASIRFRMAASPLCNAEAFTYHLETIYRQLWQDKHMEDVL